ncbi:WXG100 family type VII secretion target [Mycolicibacterium sediminis]|uniref:Uncharacterized protein n=1 Tax=Mycolicibacterium sediminis TaxID=1286180 RepID=A0A7I7QKE4_9MYCO|nr:WXG100 family type VII secretion target [Mycolicibacterium sediminis]BBY26742.1 hypothetical protein MSEDJ_08380 [Mycolicibacterium sediminis]
MSLTVSQVLASRPESLLDAAGSVARQAVSVGHQVDDARARVDRTSDAWTGAAADASRSRGSALVSDAQTYRETLDTLGKTMTTGANRLRDIRTDVQTTVEGARGKGWIVADDGQVRPGPLLQTLGATSPTTAVQIKLLALQLTTDLKTKLADFQSADVSTAEAIRRLGDDPAPKPEAKPPTPQPPPPPPPPKDSKNPAEIAAEHLGRNASDLKGSGDLPMDPSVPNDVCCANFVTATLQKAGLIDWHDNRVYEMSQQLQAQGWHAVPASEAKPGDVAVINGNQHTELVSTNVDGKITLIGSNNVNPDGSQQISYGNPYGEVVYLSPP